MAAIVNRAFTVIVCVVCVGCDWPWRHDMSDQPSHAASQGPRSPADGATPRAKAGPDDPATGEAVTNPLASDRATIESGRALYNAYCVPCHGTSGSGRDAVVAQYFPRVGDLTSVEIHNHGDGWFYAIITNGTPTMPAYGHELDGRERWQIVRFVRTLAH